MSSHIATKSKGEDLDRDPNLDPLWCCRRGIRACAPRHSRRQSHESSIVRLLCARAYTRSTCIAHRETCMDRRGKKGTKSLANLSQGSSSSALALPCFQVPVACMSQRTHTAKLPAKGGRKDVVGRPGCLAGYGGKGRARLWLWASLIKGFEPSNSNHDFSPPLMLLLPRVVVYLLGRMHVCPKESCSSLICP